MSEFIGAIFVVIAFFVGAYSGMQTGMKLVANEEWHCEQVGVKDKRWECYSND